MSCGIGLKTRKPQTEPCSWWDFAHNVKKYFIIICPPIHPFSITYPVRSCRGAGTFLSIWGQRRGTPWTICPFIAGLTYRIKLIFFLFNMWNIILLSLLHFIHLWSWCYLICAHVLFIFYICKSGKNFVVKVELWFVSNIIICLVRKLCVFFY